MNGTIKRIRKGVIYYRGHWIKRGSDVRGWVIRADEDKAYGESPKFRRTSLTQRSACAWIDMVLDVCPSVPGFGDPCPDCGAPMVGLLGRAAIDYNEAGQLTPTVSTYTAICGGSWQDHRDAINRKGVN